MQTDAGGRYAAALGRRQPGSCALGGAGSGLIMMRNGGEIAQHGAGQQLRTEHRIRAQWHDEAVNLAVFSRENRVSMIE